MKYLISPGDSPPHICFLTENILNADANCSTFTNDSDEDNRTNDDENVEEIVMRGLSNEIDFNDKEKEVNMNAQASRPSFSGLKSFCSTRWSCLLSLLTCHLKHHGKLFRFCFHSVKRCTIMIYLSLG